MQEEWLSQIIYRFVVKWVTDEKEKAALLVLGNLKYQYTDIIYNAHDLLMTTSRLI